MTTRTRRLLFLASTAIALVAWPGAGPPRAPSPRVVWKGPVAEISAAAARAQRDRQAADHLFASRHLRDARQQYRALIERHAASGDPGVGEEVAKARFRLAATLAAKRDFEAARRAYQAVVADYRGVGERDLRLGATLVERAEFEQAVCLAALGKRKAAGEAFLRFVSEHPTSGLIYAAARRANELGGAGTADRAAAALNTAAVAYDRAQRAAKRQAALCGPKALAAVCRAHGVKASASRLAAVAGTDEAGTTLAGLARAARAQGLSATGVQASPETMARLPRPLLVLARGGHYLVLTRVAAGRARLEDPSLPGCWADVAVADLPMVTDGYALVVARGQPDALIAAARKGGAR